MHNSSEQINEILPALAAAKANIGPLKASGHNSFLRSDYSVLQDYRNAIAKPLKDAGLMIALSAHPYNLDVSKRTTKDGFEETGVIVAVEITLYHPASGQWISAVGLGEGQDNGDKGTLIATTHARKQAMALMFDLAIDEEEAPAAGKAPLSRPKSSNPARPPAKKSSGGGSVKGGKLLCEPIQIAEKSGQKPGGKPWTRYGIKCVDTASGEEIWVNTFSSDAAEAAADAIESHSLLSIEVEKTDFGFDLKSIEVLASEAAPEEPGDGPLSEDDVPF